MKTTHPLEQIAPGRLEPEASTLSLLSSDGLNHAKASELGRLFHLGGAASLRKLDLLVSDQSQSQKLQSIHNMRETVTARTRSSSYKRSAIGSSFMFEKLVVIQLGALLFANTHDHDTEWVKWGGIVVSIATVVVGVATGG